MSKLDIEISVTKKGYDMKVKEDGDQILFRAFEYRGNGLTDCVSNKGEIEDYELADKLDDIEMACNDIMYIVQEEDCDEEED